MPQAQQTESEWQKYIKENKGLNVICEHCNRTTIVFDKTLDSVLCPSCDGRIDLK